MYEDKKLDPFEKLIYGMVVFAGCFPVATAFAKAIEGYEASRSLAFKIADNMSAYDTIENSLHNNQSVLLQANSNSHIDMAALQKSEVVLKIIRDNLPASTKQETIDALKDAISRDNNCLAHGVYSGMRQEPYGY